MNDARARSLLLGETRRLLAAYGINGDKRLRNRIVVLNRRLVLQVAGRAAARCTLEFDDLVQVGHLGLIKAVERFNPARGHAFSSFAVPLIRGEILHYIRDRSSLLRISRRLLEIHSRGATLQRRCQNESGRHLTERQITAQLAVTPERWRKACEARRCTKTLSLDGAWVSKGNESLRLIDTIATPGGEDGVAEVCIKLRQLLANLDVDARHLLERCVLDGASRREMARCQGISEREIGKRLRQTIQQLQDDLVASMGAAVVDREVSPARQTGPPLPTSKPSPEGPQPLS